MRWLWLNCGSSQFPLQSVESTTILGMTHPTYLRHLFQNKTSEWDSVMRTSSGEGTDFELQYLLRGIFLNNWFCFWLKIEELVLIFDVGKSKDHKDTTILELRQGNINPSEDYLPEQLEHMLKNVFHPSGKLLRISWTATFLPCQILSRKKTCAFLQINTEVATKSLSYYYTKMNFMASIGNISHIISTRLPFNHKSRFLLNYPLIRGRY